MESTNFISWNCSKKFKTENLQEQFTQQFQQGKNLKMKCQKDIRGCFRIFVEKKREEMLRKKNRVTFKY